ncbi:MAG: biotin carboxylase N-terminal domain-containing protein [Sulfuritalea sp.]|nr:biotin carboxylase N-terminal domain-containing protein [Sulfuritalea sp.]
MKTFHKILVANRGEIACRVMRTARALGYRTVAVHSAVDADAPHVMLADEAVPIGAAPAAESYLRVETLLDAARRTGADAVHPGYGFLAESAGFARACATAGLVFIGPPAEAIEVMGDKAVAKRRMIAAGVPTAPGYLDAEQDDERLVAEAEKLGFPLLVKAVAGGGGRGMRLVHAASELREAIASARREVQSAFGNDTLMLERLIERSRHIEIQVFADAHGNALHLGERDCTAQRRRQKVIEEAPSPVVSPAMREAMGRDAVAAALAVGYRGAGTVEFIVDDQLKHYFLEMNTRLQVEHPVTEMITGLDLVEWQLRIAAGEPLPLTQEQVRFSGHAIEARLYAEDPYSGFAPQTGTVLHWRPAAAAVQPDIRIDAGVIEGGAVTPWYDPLLAKVIAYGRDRDDAIRRLMAALEDAPLLGLTNNARFLRDLVDHPSFRAASMHTALLDEWATGDEAMLQRPVPDDELWCLAAAVAIGRGARPASVAGFDLSLECGGTKRTLRVELGAGSVHVDLGATRHEVDLGSEDAGWLDYRYDGIRRRIALVRDDGGHLHFSRAAAGLVFNEVSPFPAADAAHDASRVRSPVAGTVTQVLVVQGELVTAGQTVACVEAMKMEMKLVATVASRVETVRVRTGDQVASGAVLVELEYDKEA